LPPLRIDNAEGFADVDVPAQLVSADARSVVIRARASNHERPIDVEVRFLELSGGIAGTPFEQGRVEITPNGQGGDALVDALAAAWKQPPMARRMRANISAPVAVLGASDPLSAPLKTKAFLLDGSAEVYLNWDSRTKLLEIHEKDEDYRAGVIAALSR
jgi:hypothetical protein